MPIKSLYYYNGAWKALNSDYEPEDLPTNLPETYVQAVDTGDGNYYEATFENEDNINTNKLNAKKNEDAKAFNAELSKKDAVFTKVLQIATNTKGGDYLSQKTSIQNLNQQAQEAKLDADSILEQYNSFYKTEKIGNGWDVNLGAKPPAGDFDGDYYLAQNPGVQAQWDYAKKTGDLDIIEQYKNPKVFALSNYTFVGKPAGKRGNKEEELTASKEYLEDKPTDAELEGIKNKQLGIGYEALKESTPGTELETIVSEAVGADIVKKTKQFGALTQDVLKDTIKQMQQAKAKEQMLGMMGNLPGFNEIVNLNETLTESILGDTGVGGILALGGNQAKAKESLEKSLQNMTGVNTSTIYNWQQWFDNSLKKKYEADTSLGLTKKEKEEQIKVEATFAKQFIDQYLIPRFNQSKTISEFTEYVNVKDEEQNPFQTQDILNAAAEVGQLKSQSYLDQLKQLKDSYFDPKFYFNPSDNLKSEQVKKLEGSVYLQDKYNEQAQTVASDWEEAKKQVAAQNGYWYAQAYKYGVDVNDKDAFAKLHFQVQGQGKGYDAAEDQWSAAKIQDYIYTTILPAIQDKTSKMTVFGEFIKPDDFAEALLANSNVNPNDKSTWSKVLDTFKLNEFTGSYDELKTYISDTFKMNSALEIQAKLKDLQKEGVKPTQKNLGVFYIEKPTDTATKPTGDTALYQVFSKAGYGGTEKEFYENFFPDLDLEEQKVLTQAGTGKGGLQFIDFKADDPFAAFESVEKLLGGKGLADTFTMTDDADKTKDDTDYFKLGLGDEDEYKSKSGQSILGEFTSFLKGF